MSSITVTILDGKGGRRDLELPSDAPTLLLGPEVAQTIQHPDLPTSEIPFKAVLKLEGTNKIIPMHQCLEDAGVIDGDVLKLLIKPIPIEIVDNEAIMDFNGPGFIHPSGRIYPFRGRRILIGRVDRSIGIVTNVLGVNLTGLDDVDAPSVSRRHAQISLHEGEYFLQDLNSTNGCIVNGRLLPSDMEYPLNHADKVQFGDVVLYFIWDGQEIDSSHVGG